jgi:nucleoside-diphosphate-sugar epimerase
VFISTVKVHGEGRATPYTTADLPSPKNPYAQSKWEAEQALRRISRSTALEVVVLRPPLVYGPGVGANFRRLMDLVYRGVPLPLGGVRNRRSLLYVDNLADAICTAVSKEDASGQTFLVSDCDDVSTPELVRRIAAALRRPARLVSIPPSLLRAAARLARKLDAADRLLGSLSVDATIRQTLQWTPPWRMEEALSRTALWYVKQRQDAPS